ncbi:MAG: energy transducer TonB [Candidatus Cyclobacteriaceae bacterium M2_1C_046]
MKKLIFLPLLLHLSLTLPAQVSALKLNNENEAGWYYEWKPSEKGYNNEDYESESFRFYSNNKAAFFLDHEYLFSGTYTLTGNNIAIALNADDEKRLYEGVVENGKIKLKLVSDESGMKTYILSKVPEPKIQQPQIVDVTDEEEVEEDIDLDIGLSNEEQEEDEMMEEEKPADEGEIFQIVDNPATPKGGYETFYQYINENLKYPKTARNKGIEGVVYVQFVVNKDGSISDIKVVRNVETDLDAEAVRLIQGAENWNPPTQKGTPVRQRIILPVKFSLNVNNK